MGEPVNWAIKEGRGKGVVSQARSQIGKKAVGTKSDVRIWRATVKLTGLDELSYKDSDLYDGKSVDHDGDATFLRPKHAQLTKAKPSVLIRVTSPRIRLGVVDMVRRFGQITGGLVVLLKRDLVGADDGGAFGGAGTMVPRVLGEAILAGAHAVGRGTGLGGIDMVVEDGLER